MSKNHKISEDFVRQIIQRNLEVYAVPESRYFYRNVQNIDVLRSIFLREINRLQTFNGYPQDGISAIVLASNGFIYQGHGYEAVCVFCGSRYAGWRTEDDVQMINRCLCPQCPMVSGEVVSNIGLNGDVAQRIEGIHFRNDYEAMLDTKPSIESRVRLPEFRSEANVRDINEDRINTLEVTSIYTPPFPSMIHDITSVEYLTNNTNLMYDTPLCPIAPENIVSSGSQTHNIKNETHLRYDQWTTFETNEMDTSFSITSNLTEADNAAQALAFVQHDSEINVSSMRKLTSTNTSITPTSGDTEKAMHLCNDQIQTLRDDIPILPNSVPRNTNEDILVVAGKKTDTLDTASHDFDLTQMLAQERPSFSSTHTAVNNLDSTSTNTAIDPHDRISNYPNETIFNGLMLKVSTTCNEVSSSAVGLSDKTNNTEALPGLSPTHLPEYIPVTSQEKASVPNKDTLVPNKFVMSTNLTEVSNNQNEMTFTIKSAQNLKEIIFECNDKQEIEIEEFNKQGTKGLYISCPTNYRSVIKLAQSENINNMNDMTSINVQSEKSMVQSNSSEGKAISSDVNLRKLRMAKAELKGRATRSDAIRIMKENVQQLKERLSSDPLQLDADTDF